eukprot:GHVH01017402.1.p1 GENE.GHVH01017402.1~~GHVH01017402.1.p1  ORF type:complete len:137 (+),score=22.69 GHVH01017402.1:41-412(+)
MNDSEALEMMAQSPEIAHLTQQKILITNQFLSLSGKANMSAKMAMVYKSGLDAIQKTPEEANVFEQREFLFILRDKEELSKELKVDITKFETERDRCEPMAKTFLARLDGCEQEMRALISKMG